MYCIIIMFMFNVKIKLKIKERNKTRKMTVVNEKGTLHLNFYIIIINWTVTCGNSFFKKVHFIWLSNVFFS